MLKVLIRKQFLEIFKGFFVDQKTGKTKTKVGIISMFALFGFVLLALGAAFYGLAMSISILLDTEYRWLYYAIITILSIGLGTFASVFVASNVLYNSKDNDLLLSMPIKPSTILLSRVIIIYLLSIMYSSMAWIPSCLFVQVYSGFNLLTAILDILLLFVTSIFSTVLSCLFGYILGSVSRKVKNKSITTTILSLLFMGGYYYLSFKLDALLETILLNGEEYAKIISTWAYLIYQQALAADGNIISFIIFTLINIIIGYTCYLLLSKSFYKIVLSSNNVAVTTSKIKYNTKNSVSKTLLAKEAKRFISNPTYMINCGLSTILVLAAGIMFVIKQNDITGLLTIIGQEIPELVSFIPLAIILITCSISSLGTLAVPSISLEGKNLWIIKSLPIDTYKILEAKTKLETIVNGVPAIIACILMSYAFKLELLDIIDLVLIVILFISAKSYIDGLLSLINPNFNWTNEAQPVKQNMTVLYSVFLSVLLSALITVPYYFLKDKMEIGTFVNYIVIFLAMLILLLQRLIRTWGVNKFNEL